MRSVQKARCLMFFSAHTMDGDPQRLLAAKRTHMDPLVNQLAPQHGAIASITVPTDRGIVTYNLWHTAEGAAAFSEEPEARRAQQESGLPAPSSFTPYPDAEAEIYEPKKNPPTVAHNTDFESIEISDDTMRARIGAARSYTLALLTAGPQYSTGAARDIIWEHGRRNMRLQDAGILRIVCPVRDDTPLCGIGIFAADVATTETLLAADPGVKAGIFTVELHPVSGFAGSAL